MMMIPHGLTLCSLSALPPSCFWMPLRCTCSHCVCIFSPLCELVETSLHSSNTSWNVATILNLLMGWALLNQYCMRWGFHFAEGVHWWLESMLVPFYLDFLLLLACFWHYYQYSLCWYGFEWSLYHWTGFSASAVHMDLFVISPHFPHLHCSTFLFFYMACYKGWIHSRHHKVDIQLYLDNFSNQYPWVFMYLFLIYSWRIQMATKANLYIYADFKKSKVLIQLILL